VADLDNRRIRAINMASGIVRTIAGNGQKGVPTNGAVAASSPLFDPRAVAVAHNGDVYILERSGNALRVVDAKGKIRTVVGTGKAGGVVASGAALDITLNGPKHLWVDRDDTVLIADTENHAVRRYIPKDNRVVLIAGTGKRGNELNTDPLKTSLRQPHGVNVDSKGRLYISDSMNGRVLRLAQ
jgi:DNA-binding beta-propeller fold protein YncE